MITKLEKPVKLIRCGFDNNVTFGVTDVHRMDRQLLCQRAAAMVAVFPEAARMLKDIFKCSGDMFFLKATNVKVYGPNCELRTIDDMSKMTRCRLAIEFMGMKSKNGEVSHMVRAYQIKILKQQKDEHGDDDECLFSSEDDDDDESEDDGEEEEEEVEEEEKECIDLDAD